MSGKVKVIAYTAITNGKDRPRDDILCLSGYDRFQSPVMNAKIYKVMPHKFLNCDISFWMDGNIYPLKSVCDLVDEWLGDNDISLFRHYRNKNLDWELKVLQTVHHAIKRTAVAAEALEQVEHYRNSGQWPKQMFMGGLIIRRHTPVVERFNEAWWAEICQWGQRDQLSLPVVLERFPELKVNRIDGDIKNHPYLHYDSHIHYLT